MSFLRCVMRLSSDDGREPISNDVSLLLSRLLALKSLGSNVGGACYCTTLCEDSSTGLAISSNSIPEFFWLFYSFTVSRKNRTDPLPSLFFSIKNLPVDTRQVFCWLSISRVELAPVYWFSPFLPDFLLYGISASLPLLILDLGWDTLLIFVRPATLSLV